MRNQILLQTYDNAFQPINIAEKILAIPDRDYVEASMMFFELHPNFELAFLSNKDGFIHSSVRRIGLTLEPLFPGRIISKDSTLLDLLSYLIDKDFVVLMEGNRVKWLVDWQDLNKSPFTDWIFSNISLLEKCLKHKLSKDFKDDITRIYHFMPPKVRDEVSDRFNRLKNRNAETSPLNCLSFLNTLHLARNQGYFNDVISQDYDDKIAFIHSSNELRNKSALANDIITSKVDLVKLEQTISMVRKMIIQLATY